MQGWQLISSTAFSAQSTIIIQAGEPMSEFTNFYPLSIIAISLIFSHKSLKWQLISVFGLNIVVVNNLSLAKKMCPVGLGSIAKTSSARESLMIDTHHLLTSSGELDTLPPNPTSFEPLPNSLIPPKNSQEPTLCFYFSKNMRR